LSLPVAGTEGEVYRFRLHLVIKIYVALEFVLLLYWTGAGDRLFLMRRTQNFKYAHNSEYRERIKVILGILDYRRLPLSFSLYTL